jgi:gamma-glutamyltranspeptidase/glutathione hydrolase
VLTPLGHTFGPDVAELGAATAIEFKPYGGLIAAAEPVRRGGGAAGTVSPRR